MASSKPTVNNEVVRIVYYPNGSMRHHTSILSLQTNGTVLKKRLDGSWKEHNKIPRGWSFRKYMECGMADECVVVIPEILDCVPRR